MAKLSLHKPLLIMLYGFPGVGKTNFAIQFSESVNIAHVHDDRIRHELFEEPKYDKAEDQVILQLMDYMTKEFLAAGVSVIYDTNVSRASERRRLRDLARGARAEFLLVWLQIDADSAYARTQRRDRRKSEDKFARVFDKESFEAELSAMQNPKNESYVVLSGKHAFAAQRNAVMRKLYEMALINPEGANASLAKPELINLVPKAQSRGRINISRRDIVIR